MCEGRHEVEVRVLDRLGPTWSASWDHLVDSMELPSPFLRSWWLDAMAASADAPAFVLVLVEDRLLGGIAVQTERRLGVECVELLGSGPLEPDHLDVVVDPADASATALVLDEVGRWLHRPGSRVLDLVGVAPGARLFDIVARGARRRVEVAPFVALPGTHEEYLASRGGRTRGTVARSARRLGRDGSTIRIVRADRDGVDAFDAALMALARLHHTRWGDRSGFLDRWAAFTAAARSGSLRGEVWCCELVGPDQETAAVEVDFVVAGRMSFYQAGRSTDRRWRGGGSWVRSETVRAAISSGCHEFDLLRGAEPYKSEWADRSRGVWALRAGVGPIGRAAVGAAAVRAAARGRASSLLRNVWSAEDRTGPVGDGSVRRPRILFYTDADQIGGAETVARTLLSGLSDRFDVVIVGTDSTVVEHLAEARAVTTMVLDPIVDRSDVAAMAGHRRVIAALAPDVFHANLSEGSSCQYALLAALSVPGVRVVVTENSPMGVRTRLSGSIKRRSARWFDAHVAVGERTARMVEADVGLAPGRVITIPNAVPPIDRRIPHHDHPDGRLRVVAVARFDPVKGLDVLVDAMTRLVPPEPGESGSTKCGVGGHQSGASPAENAEGPAIELTIFGDGPERPAIEQRIAAAGLGAHVRLGGWVDDVGQRLGAFDVFVLPSRVEGMPVSLLEAMDAGVAVVATDVGSVREVIEDGVSGLVVAPEDPDAIASAVRSLVDDVRRHTLAEAGRDVVRAGHSAEANVAAYEALYDGVLAGPPRRSIRGRVRGRWVRGRR